MFCLRSVGRRAAGWPRFSTQIKCRKSYAMESQDAPDRKVVVPEYGQPTPASHPHLLQPGELVPGIKLSEFVSRREKLAASIAATNRRATHIVVIPSAEVQYMSDRIPYFFRQNTDFRYLTGCLEADCTLVLIVGPTGPTLKSVMFLRPNSHHSRLWEGPRTGAGNAPEMFGVDEAYAVSDLGIYIGSILKSAGSDSVLWYDYRDPAHRHLHHTAIASIMKGPAANVTVQCPRKAIHKLRWIKSVSEQELMRKAGVIGSGGIRECMKATGSGSAATEHQLYAIVDYRCRMSGAQFLAYPPVVAAGNNANIIHYINNNQRLRPGELVLMDAGCEVDGYCSDITRTWPVTGDWNDAQLTLYQIVESVQLELLESCRRSHPTLDELFALMTESLGNKLVEAKALSRQADTMHIKEVVLKLCPHHVSHYLGMDVHDTGTLPRDIQLEPGVCFTVEPGIYVEANCPLMRPEFRSYGIRIEDDVLVTESGPEILSRNCPKTISEIKSCMKSSP